MGDVLDTLQSELEAPDGLLETLNDDTADNASKTRIELLGKIEATYRGHARAQNAVSYPVRAEGADRNDLWTTHARAFQEHRAIEKCVLRDLKNANPGSSEFAGPAEVPMVCVKHPSGERDGSVPASTHKLYDDCEREELDAASQVWTMRSGR